MEKINLIKEIIRIWDLKEPETSEDLNTMINDLNNIWLLFKEIKNDSKLNSKKDIEKIAVEILELTRKKIENIDSNLLHSIIDKLKPIFKRITNSFNSLLDYVNTYDSHKYLRIFKDLIFILKETSKSQPSKEYYEKEIIKQIELMKDKLNFKIESESECDKTNSISNSIISNIDVNKSTNDYSNKSNNKSVLIYDDLSMNSYNVVNTNIDNKKKSEDIIQNVSNTKDKNCNENDFNNNDNNSPYLLYEDISKKSKKSDTFSITNFGDLSSINNKENHDKDISNSNKEIETKIDDFNLSESIISDCLNKNDIKKETFAYVKKQISKNTINNKNIKEKNNNSSLNNLNSINKNNDSVIIENIQVRNYNDQNDRNHRNVQNNRNNQNDQINQKNQINQNNIKINSFKENSNKIDIDFKEELNSNKFNQINDFIYEVFDLNSKKSIKIVEKNDLQIEFENIIHNVFEKNCTIHYLNCLAKEHLIVNEIADEINFYELILINLKKETNVTFNSNLISNYTKRFNDKKCTIESIERLPVNKVVKYNSLHCNIIFFNERIVSVYEKMKFNKIEKFTKLLNSRDDVYLNDFNKVFFQELLDYLTVSFIHKSFKLNFYECRLIVDLINFKKYNICDKIQISIYDDVLINNSSYLSKIKKIETKSKTYYHYKNNTNIFDFNIPDKISLKDLLNELIKEISENLNKWLVTVMYSIYFSYTNKSSNNNLNVDDSIINTLKNKDYIFYLEDQSYKPSNLINKIKNYFNF